MSKNRHDKSIRLTEQELRKICEEAADRSVEKHIKRQNIQIKNENRRILYNTKRLLEHYTQLKDYVENAVSTVEEAVQVDESFIDPEILIGFRVMDSDRKLDSQIRRINTMKLIMAHVDRMLMVYKADCQSSASRVRQRRWEIIQMMYLDRDERKTTKQIAEYYDMEISGVRREAKAARNDLSVLFFGINAMMINSLCDNEYV